MVKKEAVGKKREAVRFRNQRNFLSTEGFEAEWIIFSA